MKTLIVGMGIVGTIYGWALAEAGIDVTHLVRKGRAAQFKNGVDLDILDERKGHPKKSLTHYAVHCVEAITPADRYELIIVPTTAQQMEDALRMLVPVSGKAIFLTFSGSWQDTEFIDCLLPRSRYLMGYADGGGTIRDGVYWSNLGAEVHIGEVDGQPSEKLDKVCALFKQADMQPDVQENMVHWLWQHIAGSVGFAAGFAKHGNIDSYLRDKDTLHECIRSTKELYRLCQKRGVDLGKYPETSFRSWPIWLVDLFMSWNFRHNESMQRYTAHAASMSSLRETKAYYDSVMVMADQIGFAMPHTQALGRYLQHVN